MELLFYAIAAALVLGLIILYNRLVHDRERVKQAWSDILVHLKRRHDLIPKLVDAVKAYAGYEEKVMSEVTALRSRSDDWQDAGRRGPLEAHLSGSLRGLLAVAEAYPELKASDQWLNLQQNITAVEDDIQYARRYYNGAVKALNVRVDSFPSNLVARGFGFTHAPFFTLEDTASKH